jgi:hypothetical protein
MVLLFVLFPRMAPLWGLPQDGAGRTGLSGSLRLGGVASVANDDSIAMRVRFFGRVPDPTSCTSAGRCWAPSTAANGPAWCPASRRRSGCAANCGCSARRALRADARTQPAAAAAAAGDHARPARRRARIEGWTLTLRPDAQWQVDRPVTDRVRVRAKAWPRAPPRPARPGAGPARPGGLPAGYNPRSLQWARAAQQPGAGRRRCAHAWPTPLLAHMRGRASTSTRWSPALRPPRRRRVLVRPQAGLLRALRQPPSWW